VSQAPHTCPSALPSGRMASCTRSSGTSSCPSPCTRVSVSGFGGGGRWEKVWPGGSEAPAWPAGFVQFLQYYYQSGCLYRLRALGERHTMDLTVGESRSL
jgi:hypothetical protein